MSSSVVSKKLKFKGDKPKKKKRTHRETEGGGGDELEALAAADPSGQLAPSLHQDI
jgi:protein FRG1